MLRAGQALLGIGIIGFFLAAVSNIDLMGPYTHTFNASARFAFVSGTPIGLVLILSSVIRSRRKSLPSSETLKPTERDLGPY